ncbi:hypothetical protein OIU78_014837 [Salix suchowensis]|nr:hypothetical protein OIU78_014837 [Salix suchowensis]
MSHRFTLSRHSLGLIVSIHLSRQVESVLKILGFLKGWGRDFVCYEGLRVAVGKKAHTTFTLTKPSWVVRTESNIRREIRKRPDPPCEVCHGTGRVDCPPCSGQGRINSVRLAMLPKGEWPKWCRTCGGSGLSYCSRCLGTGEYRYIMGFHFMMASDDTKNHPQQHQSTAARPLNGEDLDSNHGI